jgi:hypothetical protein
MFGQYKIILGILKGVQGLPPILAQLGIPGRIRRVYAVGCKMDGQAAKAKDNH